MNFQQRIEQARNLADAIERALPAVADGQARADAEELVSTIRSESSAEIPAPGRLKALATAAMTSIATAAGTDLGKAIVEAALLLIS